MTLTAQKNFVARRIAFPRKKEFALNTAPPSESKFTMKLFRVFAWLAMLLPPALTAPAQNESLAAIFTNAPRAQHAIPRRTSIIVIAGHGLACGDLSCYGQTNYFTPNLDRLAAEGMRFTHYAAAGDDLAPAQSALMAGSPAGLAAGQPTLAMRLRQAGYATGLMGEWRLAPHPWEQGFDDFGGFFSEPEAADFYSPFIWRTLVRTPEEKTNGVPPRLVQEPLRANAGGKHGRYLPDLLFTLGEHFIEVHAPDRANHYQPFFLYLQLPEPHSFTPGKDDYSVPTDAPYSGENWPRAARNRAALITSLDASVGHLLEHLAHVGMSNNVAIFLTSVVAPEKFADTNLNFLQLPGEVRGGSSPDHLRAPMIVRWPGHVPAGRVSAAAWNPADFAPTALDIGFAKPADHYAGSSQLPVLLGRPATPAPAEPARH